MGSGNTKFLIGLGIGSAISSLICHYSRTARAQQLKSDLLIALRELEADADSAWVDTKEKVLRTSSKVAGKVADKATEVKEKLEEKQKHW